MALPSTAKVVSQLPDDVKESIQTAYRGLLEHYGFRPRAGQRRMIADIANSLAAIGNNGAEPETEKSPAPICVVEAGTGTGKTLAYMLAVLPVAKMLEKKVVLATATVALQEQVMLKDLPDLLSGSELEFSYSMAKGRGRYLCLARLDSMLQNNDSFDAMLDLYAEQLDSPAGENRDIYQTMLDAVSNGSWQGDRDEWSEPIADPVWYPVTVDNSQCIGSRCAYFRQCCFFKARESLTNSDCIVANHDLVLADLALGGGVILPDPSDTIFIFDEAHHLPFKSNNHFSAFVRLKGTMGWLQQADTALGRIAEGALGPVLAGGVDLGLLRSDISASIERMQEAWQLFEQFSETLAELDSYGNSRQHMFRLGVVADEMRAFAGVMENQFGQNYTRLLELQNRLKQLVDEGVDLQHRLQAEQWFPVIGSLVVRTEGSLKLWTSFAHPDTESSAPTARWLTITEINDSIDITLASSPVLAAANLEQRLWNNCAGAVLTSATLSALGRFDVLKMRAGLPQQTTYLSIPSPFDFQSRATLCIPRMHCDPSDTERHTQLLIASLPSVLKEDRAALMLFSSRRQMQDVLAGIDATLRDRVLCQDDYQKAALLKLHRERVDQGQVSVIFGLASFAEGVDLPGEYCTHVLIAKIPFAVPNDPIEATLSQWIEARGENPFMTLAVPEAAFRLVQACGRLLRNETDSGRITIFDERLVKRFYGKTILDSLPPYRREIFQIDLTQ